MRTLSRRMEMLMNAKILDGGTITYEEHRSHCDGCVYCEHLRLLEEAIKQDENLDKVYQETGVSEERQIYLRESLEPQRIEDFNFEPGDIYTKTGQINRETYLVLKFVEFKDTEIRDYFGINTNKWAKFKKQEFPKWKTKDNKDSVLANEAFSAYKRWCNSPKNRQIRLSNK